MVPPTKPVKALVSLITRDNDYQRAQAASAEAAAQRFGASIEVVFADSDAVNQVQQILTAIQRRNHGIDIVITEPVGTGMLNVAEHATKMGVAWCVLNRDVDYLSSLRQKAQNAVFEVSVDQDQVGRLHAQQIATLLPNGGHILYIAGPSSGSAAPLRSQGLLTAKPSNIQLQTMTSNWTEEGGYRVIRAWLKLSTSKSSGFSAVVSQNDAMAIGARRAFGEINNPAERQAWLTMPFLGCDGLPETGQQYVERKVLTATVITPAVAGTALETFVRCRQEGRQTPERVLVNGQSFPALERLHPLNAAKAP